MNLKHQVTKMSKTICFDCKSHSHFDTDGETCYRCKGSRIFTTSTNLRIPKKEREKAWEGLYKIVKAGMSKLRSPDQMAFPKRMVNYTSSMIRLNPRSKRPYVAYRSVNRPPKKLREQGYRQEIIDRLDKMPFQVVDLQKPV